MQENPDKTQLAVYVFSKQAEAYERRFMDVSRYKAGLDLFCSGITPDAQVIELACGPGNITRYLLERSPGLSLLGTDLSPEMIRLAEKNNPNARFRLMDARDLQHIGQSFDGIVAAFCLPYLSKPEVTGLFAAAFKNLKRGGLLYLSTMEGSYENSGIETSSAGDQLYIHYYEQEFLTRELTKTGFEIVYLELQEFEAGTKASGDLIILAGK